MSKYIINGQKSLKELEALAERAFGTMALCRRLLNEKEDEDMHQKALAASQALSWGLDVAISVIEDPNDETDGYSLVDAIDYFHRKKVKMFKETMRERVDVSNESDEAPEQ